MCDALDGLFGGCRDVRMLRVVCLITGLGSAVVGILKPIVVAVGSRWAHPGQNRAEPLVRVAHRIGYPARIKLSAIPGGRRVTSNVGVPSQTH
jgi:hypothetical protein